MNIFRFIIPKSLVEYITVDSTLRQGIEKMKFHRYVAIPVLDKEGKYLGTLKNDDILRHILDRGNFDPKVAEKTLIGEILTGEQARPLYHNATMSELFEFVKEHNLVPVVDDRGCFIGIVLRREVMNFLLRFYPNEDK